MTQKDFIEQLFWLTDKEGMNTGLKPINISKTTKIPEASVRRICGLLFKEGKLERKIIKQNESIYRWKNENLRVC